MKIVVTDDAGKMLGTYTIKSTGIEETAIDAIHKMLEEELELDQCTGCDNWFLVSEFGDAYLMELENWCDTCMTRISTTETP